MKQLITSLLFSSALLGVTSGQAQQVMTVDVSNPVAAIQPTMYGVFFEDINFGADGERTGLLNFRNLLSVGYRLAMSR